MDVVVGLTKTKSECSGFKRFQVGGSYRMFSWFSGLPACQCHHVCTNCTYVSMSSGLAEVATDNDSRARLTVADSFPRQRGGSYAITVVKMKDHCLAH